MPSEKVLGAVEEAEQELRKLQKENADLIKRIEALQNFIRSGLALTGAEPSAPQIPLMASHAGTQTISVGAQMPPMADQVAAVLKNAGKPLHIREIVRQLRTLRDFNGSTRPERTVWTAMKRRKGQFKRVGPNIFQLTQ